MRQPHDALLESCAPLSFDCLIVIRLATKKSPLSGQTLVKVDEANRIRLPVFRPGDCYVPEYLGPEEIVLRRVPEPDPKRQMTKEEALEAIERSTLEIQGNWDALRLETRE